MSVRISVPTDCVIEHNKKRVGKLKKPLMPMERNSDAVYQALSFAKYVMENGCPFKHSGADGVSCSDLFEASLHVVISTEWCSRCRLRVAGLRL